MGRGKRGPHLLCRYRSRCVGLHGVVGRGNVFPQSGFEGAQPVANDLAFRRILAGLDLRADQLRHLMRQGDAELLRGALGRPSIRIGFNPTLFATVFRLACPRFFDGGRISISVQLWFNRW